MTTAKTIVPFSLKDMPALIEKVFPVQRLSSESYKEQMAVQGKTLTALGSYWKGRKPLILNKACILGCLLPATNNLAKDLEIFEMLMGMDDGSLAKRLKLKSGERVPAKSYRELIDKAKRPEELIDSVHMHIWLVVNQHLGTTAHSFPELIEQLGIMRFGHRPKFADSFCGSGQIPFEAARLGCDVVASDLNPVACMLTWGSFNIIGAVLENREKFNKDQATLIRRVEEQIDLLGVETDGAGWLAKVFLYCLEARCPQSGWMVPLLPTLMISKGHRVIAELVPNANEKRYDIAILSGVTEIQFERAKQGTVRAEGRGQDPYLIHIINGIEYRTKISTLRGDYRAGDGTTGNRLRSWQKQDTRPQPDDIFQERLYCIHWMRRKTTGKDDDYEFRAITAEDLKREKIVENFLSERLSGWQEKGWIPDMRIEPGEKTDEPIRTRGWTQWHHLFNPRQLLIAGLINQFSDARSKLGTAQVLNSSSRLSRWSLGDGDGRSGGVKQTFDNQALNPLFNYGARGSRFALDLFKSNLKSFPFHSGLSLKISSLPAVAMSEAADFLITDPPYGDAVKYEEILEFFIAWFRKNPPPEFANWTWDSRRALAIKGEGEDFRQGMVAAYKRMTELMPENGIQVIMFTHQSGTIWADMANIVWASGLQVTAAWYVVTETDSALREGSYVKGTILLILRKRKGNLRTTRDDLAWDIKEEVEQQVETLTGLNQKTKALYRDENLFGDADLQMAGYAAALRVLTQYSIIDGKDMVAESIRPRVKGQVTFVDEMIEFAVGEANQALVPKGIEKSYWDKFKPAERFYLKLTELESQGLKTLDNYQNFAKAFKVADFKSFMAITKANSARLKGAIELGKTEMGDGSELRDTPLRAVLYAMMELAKNVDGADVLIHLSHNIQGFYDPTVRQTLIAIADYLATKVELASDQEEATKTKDNSGVVLAKQRKSEASAAKILRELLKNQKL
jgi:putative DNA methylase